jgi:hypothetical protein
MLFHAGSECRDLVSKLPQWPGVALGQITDAAGEVPRRAIELTLNGGPKVRHPLIVYH